MAVSIAKSFSFSTLFRASINKTLAISKTLDDKLEQFVEKLAKLLQADIEQVRPAIHEAMLVFEEDEKSLKQKQKEEEKRIKEEEKEAKKKQKEIEKAEKAKLKEIEKAEKAKQKELEKAEKAKQKELEKAAKASAKSPKSKKSPKAKEEEKIHVEITKINDFDFSSEPIRKADDEFWKDTKKGNLQDQKVFVQKHSGVVLTQDDSTCIGVFNKSHSKIIDVSDLSETVKKWIYKCGIKIDYQVDELELEPADDELDIDIDIQDTNEDELDVEIDLDD